MSTMSDFVHKIKVIELTKRDSYNNVYDVISHARWVLETYHKDYPDSIEVYDGATPFRISVKDLSEENFTPIDQLTENMIIEWITINTIGLGKIKYDNQKRLESYLFSPKTVLPKMPWETEETTTEETTTEETTTEL